MKLTYCTLTLLVIHVLLIPSNSFSQSVDSLTIDSCYAWARKYYPLTRQYSLIEKSKDYSIENANKGYLPQLSINGQATYQSDVTAIPIKIPNINIDPLSPNQYRLYAEISQSITDLFVTKDNKNLINSTTQVEEQKIEIELYKLRDRINNLFFSILMIDAQLQQTSLLIKDLQSGIDKTTIAITNGVALKSTIDNLKVELLKVNQRVIELKSTRNGLVSMLSLFIGKPILESTVIVKPQLQVKVNTINRPELKLYDLQKQIEDSKSKLISIRNIPRLSLFFQGGLGRPALNMLSNDLNGYYITGLRLNWNLMGLYSQKNEKKIVTLNQSAIDIQKNIFLFNTNLSVQQKNSEINKIEELINTDREIISLREKIKNTINNQLAFGTVTITDYTMAVNAQDQAQQSLLLHQIQLLLAHYNYQTLTGN